jgi:membrane protein
MISTYGFGLYVANFGSYNKVYGGLGAGIVLLIWMYVTSLVFLVGAVFNRQYEVFFSENAQVGAPPSPFEDASPPSSTG